MPFSAVCKFSWLFWSANYLNANAGPYLQFQFKVIISFFHTQTLDLSVHLSLPLPTPSVTLVPKEMLFYHVPATVLHNLLPGFPVFPLFT